MGGCQHASQAGSVFVAAKNTRVQQTSAAARFYWQLQIWHYRLSAIRTMLISGSATAGGK